MLIVIGLSVTSVFAINKLVINKVYRLGSTIDIDNVLYTINNSYVVNTALDGTEIKKDTYYMIVEMNLKNTNKRSYTLDISNTRIKVGDKYYYPKVNPSSKFNEFGTVYKKQSLAANSNNDYIIVYEVDKKVSNALLEIYSGRKETSGEVKFYYKNVGLRSFTFKNQNLGEYALNSSIDLSKTYFKKGKFSISEYSIVESETYTYNKCLSENNCTDYQKVVAPSGNKNILKINYNLDINRNIFMYLKVNGKMVNDITPSDYTKNVALVEIPNDITQDNIKLEFDIRGASFKIK